MTVVRIDVGMVANALAARLEKDPQTIAALEALPAGDRNALRSKWREIITEFLDREDVPEELRDAVSAAAAPAPTPASAPAAPASTPASETKPPAAETPAAEPAPAPPAPTAAEPEKPDTPPAAA